MQDPADRLIAFEEASEMPIRPEYVEETVTVPPPPDDAHSDGAGELSFQFRVAGHRLVGMGNGYRAAHKDGRTMALLIPDFYVRRRKATELDESYRRAHKGWYPIDMIALVGELISTNHETDTGPKLRTYAAADDPTEAYYATETKAELGLPLPLPASCTALETAPFLEPME